VKIRERLERIADLKDLVMEIDLVMRGRRDLLAHERRIREALTEARAAAQTKYEDEERLFQ